MTATNALRGAIGDDPIPARSPWPDQENIR
jgi:hypothetical protein